MSEGQCNRNSRAFLQDQCHGSCRQHKKIVLPVWICHCLLSDSANDSWGITAFLCNLSFWNLRKETWGRKESSPGHSVSTPGSSELAAQHGTQEEATKRAMWYIKLEQIYYCTCGRYILVYFSNDLWRELLGNFENKTDHL